MKKMIHTEQIIEDLVSAVLGKHAPVREAHLLRENLRNLVRMAKAEQLADIRDSVKGLASSLDTQTARRRAKAILMAQRLPRLLDQSQQTLGFLH